VIRFAAMLAALPRDRNALPPYLQSAPEADRDACLALLNGQRPRRIASLDAITHWAAEIAGIPDWLLAASLLASGDRAETAALILPPPTGTPPGLAEVLQALAATTPITRHAALVGLWSRLPPEANLILNRLASGTFRVSLPMPAPEAVASPRTLFAVMVLFEPALPAVTLALWHDGTPIPIARVPLDLPERQEILDWARENTRDRFGPVRTVPAEWVFELAFDGLSPNRRRKSGVELRNPRLVALRRDASAATLAELHSLLPPS
jgi:hypothetical protein